MLSLLVFTPNLAGAEKLDKAQQTMIYEVYAGGIHALQGQMTINENNPEHYTIKLSAKTRGLLGKLAPWHGTFESQGWNEGQGRYRPELHQSIATWRGEEETKSYHYTRDGSFKNLVITETGKKPTIKKPDTKLTDQTTDVLTATLEVLQAIAAGKPCKGRSDVFDGKRRFTQIFHDKGEETLKKTKYNIYEGPAKKCTVEVQPKGGKWHKKPRGWMSIQEQGREKGTMPTLWVAQIEKDAPAVPVKLLVKTNYGNLFMHLTEYQGSGDILVAKKRKELKAKDRY